MGLNLTYEPEKNPTLRTDGNAYEVTDISEMGLRFYNYSKMDVRHRVFGTVTLLCGKSIDVEGMVVRKNPVHISMNVKIPIERNVLVREQQYMQKPHGGIWDH